MTAPEVEALRAWCGQSIAARSAVESEVERSSTHQNTAGFGRYAAALDAARALLAAAPALLARIEAANRALGGARCWVASAASHDEDARKDLAVIDAFLAGKEASRG